MGLKWLWPQLCLSMQMGLLASCDSSWVGQAGAGAGGTSFPAEIFKSPRAANNAGGIPSCLELVASKEQKENGKSQKRVQREGATQTEKRRHEQTQGKWVQASAQGLRWLAIKRKRAKRRILTKMGKEDVILNARNKGDRSTLILG